MVLPNNAVPRRPRYSLLKAHEEEEERSRTRGSDLISDLTRPQREGGRGGEREERERGERER